MEISQVVELVQALQKPKQVINSPFVIGQNVFIRTVTLYYTGKVKDFNSQWVTLENASWIADTGRFHNFLKDGECNEYESFIDDVSIPVGSIIDVTKWNHSLFSGNK